MFCKICFRTEVNINAHNPDNCSLNEMLLSLHQMPLNSSWTPPPHTETSHYPNLTE